MVVQEYGDKAPECAEAYFYYGKALLEAARLEAGVLGNIDTDESEEKSDEDDEYGDYQDGDEKEESEESAEGEAEKAETVEGDSKVDAEPEKEKEEIAGDNKETEDAAEQEAEDEDDPSNLQLSWEMLELAKMVLVDQLEGEKKNTLTSEARVVLEKRLFETYLILGEVSLENENYPQAVEDLSICLDKQKVCSILGKYYEFQIYFLLLGRVTR